MILAVKEAARRKGEQLRYTDGMDSKVENEVVSDRANDNTDYFYDVDWWEVARDVQMYCELGTRTYNAENRQSPLLGPVPIVEQYWNYKGYRNFNRSRVHTRKRFFDIGKIEEPNKRWKYVLPCRHARECYMKYANDLDPDLNKSKSIYVPSLLFFICTFMRIQYDPGPWTREEELKLAALATKYKQRYWPLIAEELGEYQ